MDKAKMPIERRAPEPSPEDLSPDLQERDATEPNPDIDRWAAEAVREILDQFTEMQKQTGLSDEKFVESINKAISRMAETQEKVFAFYASEEFKVWQRIFTNVTEWLDMNDPAYTMAVINTFNPLLPYLEKEIETYKKETGVSDVSLASFMDSIETSPNGVFAKMVLKAQELEDEKAEKTEKKVLPRLSPQLDIITYGILNDKTVNDLLRPVGKRKRTELNGQMFLWVVDQSSSTEPDSIPVYMSLSYEGNDQRFIKTSKPVTAFDEAVTDTVSTIIFNLMQAGVPAPYKITPEEIWRKMNGIRGNKKTPSAKQLEAIRASADKLRFTGLYMDLSLEQAAGRTYYIDDERIRSGKVETYYFKADYGEVTTETGRTVMAYKFEEAPFLFTYSLAKGNILLYDYDLLDTSDTTQNDEFVPEFRRYLLQQIKLMYRKKRDNPVIKYETLYRDSGILPPAERLNKENYTSNASYASKLKGEAKKDRDKINNILQSWKNKQWILDYEPVKAGRSIYGVKVILNPESYAVENKQDITDAITGTLPSKSTK